MTQLPLYCCYILRAALLIENSVDCMDNEIAYKVGAMWKSEDCYTCYCGKVTAICCTDYAQAPDVPNNCEAIFDKRLCKYKVYSKENPDVLCDM
ncbi:beta-microseminoprotein-like [Cetorhinus maximus]